MAWVAAFVPIAIVLVILAGATMRSPKFVFTLDEYNDQLKFARSLAVTTAAICLIFLVRNSHNPLGYGPVTGGPAHVCEGPECDAALSWSILLVYILCLIQIMLFLAYEFIFENYTEATDSGHAAAGGESQIRRPVMKTARNYVQIALIMCAYLAGMTWVTERASSTFPLEIFTLILFGGIWGACAIQVLLFVQRNFSISRPIDAVQPLHPRGVNVVTLQQLPANSDEQVMRNR